ncbi:MAG: serine protein kinase RIO [Candidatus Woesearchaeota archaeon]
MVRKSRKGREEWKTYKNVFDSFTERNLFTLSNKGYFTRLITPLALGKEANIFIAEKGDDHVIVKIYRLENCNFNQMFNYISNDPRFIGLENQKRKVIFSWVQREYRNLITGREKIKVPTPHAFKDNILIMEMIGDPANQLKNDVPDDIEEFFEKTVSCIKKLLDAGLVHGDLSEFNILNDDGEPVFIDMSQSTTIKAYNAKELLERDVKNIIRFFSKHMKVRDILPEILDHLAKVRVNV